MHNLHAHDVHAAAVEPRPCPVQGALHRTMQGASAGVSESVSEVVPKRTGARHHTGTDAACAVAREIFRGLFDVGFGHGDADDPTLGGAARIPSGVFVLLPEPLRKIADAFERDVPKEVVLTAAISTLSSVFVNVEGEYAHKVHGPQAFVGLV